MYSTTGAASLLVHAAWRMLTSQAGHDSMRAPWPRLYLECSLAVYKDKGTCP